MSSLIKDSKKSSRASSIVSERSRRDSSNHSTSKNESSNILNNEMQAQSENDETETCEESIENIQNYCQNYIIDSKHSNFFKSELKTNNNMSYQKIFSTTTDKILTARQPFSYFDNLVLQQQQQQQPYFHSKQHHHHHHNHQHPNRQYLDNKYTIQQPIVAQQHQDLIYTTTAMRPQQYNIQQTPYHHQSQQQHPTEYVSIRYFAPVQKVLPKIGVGEQSLNGSVENANKGLINNDSNKKIDLMSARQTSYLPDINKYFVSPYSNELLQQYKSVGLDSSQQHLSAFDRPISSLWNLTGGDSNNSSTLNRNFNRGIDTKSANNFINRSPLYGVRRGGAGSTNYNEFLELTPKDQDFKRFLKIGLITAFISVLIVAVVIGSVLGATLSIQGSNGKDITGKNYLRSSMLNESLGLSNQTQYLHFSNGSTTEISVNVTKQIFTEPKFKNIYNRTFVLRNKLAKQDGVKKQSNDISAAVLSNIVEENEEIINNSTVIPVFTESNTTILSKTNVTPILTTNTITSTSILPTSILFTSTQKSTLPFSSTTFSSETTKIETTISTSTLLSKASTPTHLHTSTALEITNGTKINV